MPERSGSTPIVWGDRDLPERGGGREAGVCGPSIANAGTVRWKRPLGGGNRRMMKQQMSSPSPVTDGRTVWVMTGTGVLKAFDFDGTERWTRDIQTDYGRFGLQWGYASSPLLLRGFAVRAGAARHAHRRPLLRPAHRQGERQDACGGWSARRARGSNRPTPTRRPRSLRHSAAREIVITGGDVVTGHDLATAVSCGAPTA